MDSIDVLPDAPITDRVPISQAFLARGGTTFGEACRQVRRMHYGYNTTREDPLISLYVDGSAVLSVRRKSFS